MRPVVGTVEYEGVIGDAEFIEQIQELPDVHVVLDHAVSVFVLTGDPVELESAPTITLALRYGQGEIARIDEETARLRVEVDVLRADVDKLQNQVGEVNVTNLRNRVNDLEATVVDLDERLVVVEDGDVEDLRQAVLDLEALGRLDVLQVDATEGRSKLAHAIDKFVDVLGAHFQVDGMKLSLGPQFHSFHCETFHSMTTQMVHLGLL